MNTPDAAKEREEKVHARDERDVAEDYALWFAAEAKHYQWLWLAATDQDYKGLYFRALDRNVHLADQYERLRVTFKDDTRRSLLWGAAAKKLTAWAFAEAADHKQWRDAFLGMYRVAAERADVHEARVKDLERRLTAILTTVQDEGTSYKKKVRAIRMILDGVGA